MSKYNIKYRTFDQLLASVKGDFEAYNLEDLIKPHQLIKVAKRVNKDLGLNAMNDENYDTKLKSFTKIMRENKVFGVPTFLYKNERYWGQDRIETLYNRILKDK